MKKYYVLVSSLSMALISGQALAMSALQQYFSPKGGEHKRGSTESERLERRKATVDYWKSISGLVDKSGISKNDPVYKRTHANLERTESILKTYGGRPMHGGYGMRKPMHAKAMAMKKSAEKAHAKEIKKMKAKEMPSKKAPSKKEPSMKEPSMKGSSKKEMAKAKEAAPHKKSLMERMFG